MRVLSLVGILLCSLQGWALGGTGGDCKKVAAEALAQYGVSDYEFVTTDKWGQAPQDWWMWYTSKSCSGPGYINVVTDANCYLKQVITRYKCRIPGIPHGFH